MIGIALHFVTVLLLLPSQASSAVKADDFDLGMEKFREGKLDEARRLLEMAAVNTPGSADVWKALGLTFLRSADYTRAVDPLRQACELTPAGDDACYLEGRTLYLLGRYEDASGPLSKARKNGAPGDLGKVDRAIALNAEKLGDALEAERRFLAAITASRNFPSQEDPHIDYGGFLVRQGRASDALGPLQQALTAHPESMPANAEIGRALLDLDRPEQAVRFLQKAIAIDPKAWNIRMLLGKTYLRLGRAEEGERELKAGRDGWARSNHGSAIVQ